MELDTAGETFGEVPRPQMLAWHSDPDLKAEALMRMKTHQVQDEIIQGTYFTETNVKIGPGFGSGFKGCFHGCLTSEKYMQEHNLSSRQFYKMFIETYSGGVWYHEQGELIWGIPESLGFLLDETFESLDGSEEAAMFAVESIEAMAVGADLNGVAETFDEAEGAVYDNPDADPRWETEKGRAQILLQMLREAPVPNQEK